MLIYHVRIFGESIKYPAYVLVLVFILVLVLVLVLEVVVVLIPRGVESKKDIGLYNTPDTNSWNKTSAAFHALALTYTSRPSAKIETMILMKM